MSHRTFVNPTVERRLTTRAFRPHIEGISDTLARAFAALADPTRRGIPSLLLEDDMAGPGVASGGLWGTP
mgnify:CR=1 FL=1